MYMTVLLATTIVLIQSYYYNTVHVVCKTERFQAVQESAQYRVVELVQTIREQRKCFYSEFHALSDHQKTVMRNLDQ